MIDNAWRCDQCGEMVEQFDPRWRWTGEEWQHHHGYPIGHVPARDFGPRLSPEIEAVAELLGMKAAEYIISGRAERNAAERHRNTVVQGDPGDEQ